MRVSEKDDVNFIYITKSLDIFHVNLIYWTDIFQLAKLRNSWFLAIQITLPIQTVLVKVRRNSISAFFFKRNCFVKPVRWKWNSDFDWRLSVWVNERCSSQIFGETHEDFPTFRLQDMSCCQETSNQRVPKRSEKRPYALGLRQYVLSYKRNIFLTQKRSTASSSTLHFFTGSFVFS